jgi:hypothetical protein
VRHAGGQLSDGRELLRTQRVALAPLSLFHNFANARHDLTHFGFQPDEPTIRLDSNRSDILSQLGAYILDLNA